jgi:hypothetical protein
MRSPLPDFVDQAAFFKEFDEVKRNDIYLNSLYRGNEKVNQHEDKTINNWRMRRDCVVSNINEILRTIETLTDQLRMAVDVMSAVKTGNTQRHQNSARIQKRLDKLWNDALVEHIRKYHINGFRDYRRLARLAERDEKTRLLESQSKERHAHIEETKRNVLRIILDKGGVEAGVNPQPEQGTSGEGSQGERH